MQHKLTEIPASSLEGATELSDNKSRLFIVFHNLFLFLRKIGRHEQDKGRV